MPAATLVADEATIVPLFVIPPVKVEVLTSAIPNALAWPVTSINPLFVLPPRKVGRLSVRTPPARPPVEAAMMVPLLTMLPEKVKAPATMPSALPWPARSIRPLFVIPPEKVEATARMPAAEPPADVARDRSEEHTSELQSRLHLVCRLLLEK